MRQWTLDKIGIFSIWLLFNWLLYYILQKCMLMCIVSVMNDLHSLSWLEKWMFSMQNPHLVSINMILWPKLAKQAIGNWNFRKILCIFFHISVILAYPLTTCPLLMAKIGFSTPNYIEKVSIHFKRLTKLSKQAPK